jgi:hypothetical protein
MAVSSRQLPKITACLLASILEFIAFKISAVAIPGAVMAWRRNGKGIFGDGLWKHPVAEVVATALANSMVDVRGISGSTSPTRMLWQRGFKYDCCGTLPLRPGCRRYMGAC